MAFKFEDIGDLSYIKRITLDTSGGNSLRIVEAKQGDIKSRYLEITVTQNDTPFNIADSVTPRIRGTKPDGKSFLVDGDVNNGLVYIEFTEQILAAVGRVRCDVGLYSGESLLSTVTFYVDVAAKPYDENKVESSDEFSALENALARVDAATSNAKNAASKAEAAATAANEAADTVDLIVLKALTEAKESGEFVGEKGDKGETGANGKDGVDGYTPQKGIDYYTESDKQEIVNLVLAAMPSGGGDVVGYVDDNNTIVLTGSLTAGTYTFKYEGTDGTVGDIGTFTIEGGEAYINLVPTSIDTNKNIFNTTGYKQGYRLNSSGNEAELAGAITSGFIPFGTASDIIRITGLDVGTGISATGNNILFYNSSFSKIGYIASTGGGQAGYTVVTDEVTGTQMFTVDFSAITLTTGGGVSNLQDVAYIRVSLNTCSDPTTFIVTLNEEIV